MNNVNHWNWLKDLEAFQHSRDSLLSRSPTHKAASHGELAALEVWSPVMEITENEKDYLIKAELLGLTMDDVKVSAEPGTLTILGQRKFEAKNPNEKPQGPELVSSTFGRTFLLPTDASAKVSSELKDGVLVVRLMKVEKATPGRVNVTVS